MKERTLDLSSAPAFLGGGPELTGNGFPQFSHCTVSPLSRLRAAGVNVLAMRTRFPSISIGFPFTILHSPMIARCEYPPLQPAEFLNVSRRTTMTQTRVSLSKFCAGKFLIIATLLSSLLVVTEHTASAQVVSSTKNPLQIAILHWYRANLTTRFAVGASPQGLAFDGANVWTANADGGTVTKLRASDGASLGTFAVGNEAANLLSVARVGTF